MQVSRLAINSFLSLMAIISLWIVWYFAVDFNFQRPFNPSTPDEFGQDVHIISMNSEGRPSYQFFSPAMQHIPSENRTIFSSPVLEIYQKKASTRNMTAKNGETKPDGQDIDLKNDKTVLHTSSAIFYQDSHLIVSQDKMTATRADSKLESQGFQCDLQQKTITLLSKVHGVYLSTKKQFKPVDITSDKAVINQTSSTAVFEGNVKLIQDKSMVLTPELTLYFDDEKNLNKAVGAGPGTVYQTHEKANKPPFIAKAQEIQYFPRDSLAILKGHAIAQQGENSYSAPEIRYHIQNDSVLSVGGRVNMVILPKSLKKSA